VGANSRIDTNDLIESFEKWLFIPQTDGTVCIQNNEHKNYIAASNDGSAGQDIQSSAECNTMAKWTIEPTGFHNVTIYYDLANKKVITSSALVVGT
jgi:hypothetical protein